jgi:hypothetical protein
MALGHFTGPGSGLAASTPSAEYDAAVYDTTPASWGITKPWNLPVTPSGSWWPPSKVTKSP